MKSKLQENNGSTTVIIMIVLGTIIAAVIGFVTLTKEQTEIGTNRNLLLLAGRSVLSEYSIPLKDEYGIFGINALPTEIAEKLEFYMRENTGKKFSSASISTGDFRLNNVNNFENAIVEYAKFTLVDHILDRGDEASSSRDDNRVLRNQKIIKMLPSESISGTSVNMGDMADAMGDVDSMFDKTKKSVLANLYIVNMFNNHANDNGKTFFKNEVEYIIAGELRDSKNYSKVKNKIVLLRNIINLACIYKIPELKAEVTALAALTGIGMELAVPIIAEAWALLESYNDVKILEHGGKVPIVKTKETWAIDINSIIDSEDAEYIDTESETGMDYEDYLNVFLYFTDKEQKYLRAMDLMQINIQGKHDEDFNMNTVSEGFRYEVEMGGKTYKKEERY